MFKQTFVAAFVVTVMSFAANCTCAQGTGSDGVKKFLLRIVSAREMIVQYQCRCSLETTGAMRAVYPNGLNVVFEYSRIDDHFVVLYDYSRCKPEEQKPASWVGRSGEYYLAGNAGEKTYLAPWRGQTGLIKSLTHLDVMGLGLGFCGDMKLATKFEKLVLGIKTLADVDMLQLQKKKDGLWALSMKQGIPPSYTFDAERGYWPVRSELAYARWELGLTKVGEIDVPETFRVECLEGKKQGEVSGTISGKIDWISVNEPFSTGKEAVERITDEMAGTLLTLPQRVKPN